MIALGQTACGDEDPAGAFLLQLAMFENRIDRLLLGFFDKAAGIDDDDFSFLRVVGQLETVVNERAQHELGVHLVFRASEIHESDGGFAGGNSRLCMGGLLGGLFAVELDQGCRHGWQSTGGLKRLSTRLGLEIQDMLHLQCAP